METVCPFAAEGWCEQHHGASRTSPPTKCYQNIVGAPLVARYQTNGTNKRFGGAPHIVSHRRGGVSPPVFYKGSFIPTAGGPRPSPTEIEGDRLFVRSRKVVRTRMRTPHPSAFGCHLPPLGKAFAKCEHRLKPRDGANPLVHCRDRRPRLSTMRTNIWRHTKPHHIL